MTTYRAHRSSSSYYIHNSCDGCVKVLPVPWDRIVAFMLVSPPIPVGRNHGQQWNYVLVVAAAPLSSSPIIFCCCLLLCPPATPAEVVLELMVAGSTIMPFISEHAEKSSSPIQI